MARSFVTREVVVGAGLLDVRDPNPLDREPLPLHHRTSLTSCIIPPGLYRLAAFNDLLGTWIDHLTASRLEPQPPIIPQWQLPEVAQANYLILRDRVTLAQRSDRHVRLPIVTELHDVDRRSHSSHFITVRIAGSRYMVSPVRFAIEEWNPTCSQSAPSYVPARYAAVR